MKGFVAAIASSFVCGSAFLLPSETHAELSGSVTTAFSKSAIEGTLNGGLPTSSTDQLIGTYQYVSQVFIPSVSGDYKFGMTAASYDPVMIFYTGTFDASNPLINFTDFNDDGHNLDYTCGNVAGYCPEITKTLSAGTVYYIVVSSLRSDVQLTFPLDFYVLGAPVTLDTSEPEKPPVIVVIVRNSFVPNSTKISHDAAVVLDSFVGNVTDNFGVAITSLAVLPSEQQTLVLDKLVPIPSRATNVVLRDVMASSMNRISDRLDVLRTASGNQITGFQSITGLASGDAVAEAGVWVKAFSSNNNQDTKDGFAGYSNKGWGLAGGFDRELSPGFITGLGLVYTDSSISYQDQLAGSTTDIFSYQISGYASKEIGSAYIESMVAYSVQNYEGRRNTAISGYAKSDFDGEQWGMRIGGGLPYSLSENTEVVPQIRLDWNQIQQDSYTEKYSELALNVKDTKANLLRSSLGAQLNYYTDWEALSVQPFVRVFWNHDFMNDGIDTTANFVGGGTAFVTPGQDLDKDIYSAGAGVTFYSSSNFAAMITYDYDFASQYRAGNAQAMVSWLF
ncbi:MAG: autotransporter outer membrane beta-barrel domain-containing protein [Shewanella sp.]